MGNKKHKSQKGGVGGMLPPYPPATKKLKGGAFRAPFAYVDPSYSQPAADAGKNLSVSSGQIVRDALPLRGGGGECPYAVKQQNGGCGCGLPAPIAARDMSRNEPLYPLMHQRLIGGKRKTKKLRRGPRSKVGQTSTKRRALRGGFTPAIMGPLVDNFGYVAPAVTLMAYRYYKQIKKGSSHKGSKTRRHKLGSRHKRA